MSAQDTHTSFGALTESAFKVHANAVMGSHPTAAERKQVFAYLSQVCGADRTAIETDTKAVFARRVRHRKQQRAIDDLYGLHDFDPLHASSVFTTSYPSDAAILTLLTISDTHVSLGARTVTGNLIISGSNITLSGTGATGNAVADTLAHTAQCVGQIQISGSNTVLRGIHFVCGLAAPSIIFTGPCSGLTIEDCTFSSTSTYRDAQGGGSVFIYGGSQHFGGSFTMRNCKIGIGGANSFGSWMLADLNSAGTGIAPTKKLDDIVIDANRFIDCAGSFDINGMQSQPTDSCTITNNVLALQPTGDYSQHPDLRSQFDVINCLRVVVSNNTVTGASRVSGASETDLRVFLYCSNGSPHSWVIKFTGNTLSEFNVALAIPCIAQLYAPSILRDGFAIGSAAGEISGVDLACSLTYPYYTGTYAPVNIAHIPSVPLAFADSLPSHPS